MQDDRQILKSCVIWLTGLSGAGKTTIARELERELICKDKAVCILDGDALRLRLNSDLGFSMEDRHENIRRIAEVPNLFREAGFWVIVSAITPLNSMHEKAKRIIGSENYIEVYVKCDVNICRERDPKSLYKKACAGEIKEFTGISSLYEIPQNFDVIVETDKVSLEQSVNLVLRYIEKYL